MLGADNTVMQLGRIMRPIKRPLDATEQRLVVIECRVSEKGAAWACQADGSPMHEAMLPDTTAAEDDTEPWEGLVETSAELPG